MKPGKYPLIVATDRLPLNDTTDPVLGRGHAALMHTVASYGGAWIAATDSPRPAASWLQPLHVPTEMLAAHRGGHCATTLASAYFGHHGVIPVQEAGWRSAYEQVNARYAEVIAERAADGAVVWVHDFPLQLVPGMLRRVRPDLRIGFSLHSPFPPAESFLALAGREDLLTEMAAADLASFQDSRSAANFTGLVAALAPDCAMPSTSVTPMPADTRAVAYLAASAPVQAHAARIRAALRPASTVFLSTGGNDTGDGTLQRLEEFAHLLATGQLDPQRHVLIHLAPAGGDVTLESGRQRQDTERLTAQINGRHGRPGHCPVHYQRADFTLADRTAFYLAADVMLATPMRDRTTPHAAEYVAARTRGSGRVIVSEFSATAAQLHHAMVINPHAPDALGRAMLTAADECRVPSPDVTAMRQAILDDGISGWAQGFLHTLAMDLHPIAAQAPPNNERGGAATRRLKSIRHHQEGPLHCGQASDSSIKLTVTAPHP